MFERCWQFGAFPASKEVENEDDDEDDWGRCLYRAKHVHVLLESAKLSQGVVRSLPALKLFVHAIGNMLEVSEINIVETQASREFPNSFNRI